MGRQIIHMCLDIRGAIDWSPRLLRSLVRDKKTRQYVSAREAREYLLDRLAEGKRVLPMCDCPGFDFQKGCPGKELAEDDAPARGFHPETREV